MNKTLKNFIINVIAFSIFAVFAVYAINHSNEKVAQQFTASLEEALDDVDREMAIMELSELRGRILEIESLSHNDIQNILLDELEEITSFQNFTNPYLNDFSFVIPNTSNVGELCEELISQIDDQIYTIRFGAEGA